MTRRSASSLAGQSALRMAIARELRDAGVEIPSPQPHVRIRSALGLAAPGMAGRPEVSP